MITSWHMAEMSVPGQFIQYARAYLIASIEACSRMASNKSECTWANGAVVNLLAAHSVELFLKGMILLRDPDFAVSTHDIDYLINEFSRRFHGDDFQVEFLYRHIFLGDGSIDEGAWRKSRTDPSLLYRYPVNNKKEPWKELCGIKPTSFHVTLQDWLSDFDRMVERVKATN
jgi:hypothetical protein